MIKLQRLWFGSNAINALSRSVALKYVVIHEMPDIADVAMYVRFEGVTMS